MEDPGSPGDSIAWGASQAITDAQESSPRTILPPPPDGQHDREVRERESERERAFEKACEVLRVDKALKKQVEGVCDSFMALFDIDAIDEKQRVTRALEQLSEVWAAL